VKRLLQVAVAVSLITATADVFALDFAGASLDAALIELQARGLPILYSSDLVKPDMRVTDVPTAESLRAILVEIVAPHGIAVVEGPGGMLLLVRDRHAKRTTAVAVPQPALAEVVVTASRYSWVRMPQVSLTRLSEAELRVAPNVGDDPLRTIARLPGAVTSDLSAKINVRGGVADETLVRFDGLRLQNPYHLKDFQSVFSAINPALVGAADIYTGGFPVSFGDRMSSVIDIHPVRAESQLRGELAASLYNTAGSSAGRYDRGRGDWAIAARRGNLDRVLEWSGMHLGEPAYADVYAHLGHRIGESVSISANLLRFDDDIELADSDLEEQARARYRDRYLWLRLDTHPHESLAGTTLVARADLESVRSGAAEQPGISRGSLDDRREFTIDTLQTDWTWRAADAAVVQFGGEWRGSAGSYRYRDEAEFDLRFDVIGASDEVSRTRDLAVRPSGDYYGAYASLRVELAAPLTLEAGARCDRSTLAPGGTYCSPRVSTLYRLNDAASVRASWGRFTQTPGIDELPVSDGVIVFNGAQRADQWLLSYEYALPNEIDLRAAAYLKHYSRLAPRFENFLNDVVILPELKPDRIRIAALQARATGIELSLRSVRSRPLFWWMSYAWSQAQDVLAGDEVPRSWDQTHTVNVGLGWDSELWEASLAGAWHSGWPRAALEEFQVVDDEPVVRADLASNARYRAYLDLDARLARKFHFGSRSSLTVFFEVRNVLNRRNECCTDYEIDDESEEPQFVTESVRSLPLLPSLGVIWEF
jgi:outer membrane receptor protein involved in Fe transport